MMVNSDLICMTQDLMSLIIKSNPRYKSPSLYNKIKEICANLICPAQCST